MNDPVKKIKRRYRSKLRATQAQDTRKAILDAARKLFTEKGWETPISAIALEASVSKETIYAVFGNKQAILEQLITALLRGSDDQTPLIDQPDRVAILAETNEQVQIQRFSSDIASILARVAPLVDVVQSAARSSQEIAALYDKLHRGRRNNLKKLVMALAANGMLREGLDPDRATDTVWRLASPELFLLVTRTEGLTQADYAIWLTSMLKASLLKENSPDPA